MNLKTLWTLQTSAEPLVHEDEHEERDGKPEHVCGRSSERIVEERERETEHELLRNERHDDGDRHAEHERAHDNHPPEDIVGRVRDMEIEEVLIDRREKDEEQEERECPRVFRIDEDIGRQHRDERERDVDVDEDVHELVPPEREPRCETHPDKEQYESDDGRDVLRESDRRKNMGDIRHRQAITVWTVLAEVYHRETAASKGFPSTIGTLFQSFPSYGSGDILDRV